MTILSLEVLHLPEIKLLNGGFRDVNSGRSVRENLIEKAVRSNSSAKKLSEIFSMETIKNRIKYEIRKSRMNTLSKLRK